MRKYQKTARHSFYAPRDNGFTLIELLVVIAIIVLLVSILVPSLNRARELARAAVCRSNVRNIFLGMNLYGLDFDGVLPQAYSHSSSSYQDFAGGKKYIWPMLLSRYEDNVFTENGENPSDWYQAPASYVGSRNVFLCPSVDRAADIASNWGDEERYNLNGHYGLNGRCTRWANYLSFHLMQQPAETYMIADAYSGVFDHTSNSDTDYSLRHGSNDSLHILFGDGHMELTEEDDIILVGEVTYGVDAPWWNGVKCTRLE